MSRVLCAWSMAALLSNAMAWIASPQPPCPLPLSRMRPLSRLPQPTLPRSMLRCLLSLRLIRLLLPSRKRGRAALSRRMTLRLAIRVLPRRMSLHRTPLHRRLKRRRATRRRPKHRHLAPRRLPPVPSRSASSWRLPAPPICWSLVPLDRCHCLPVCV